MHTQTFLVLFAICVFLGFATCTKQTRPREVSIAFYNCENFFDTLHNPSKDDEDFTPRGKYHYTQKIYEQKAHNIATVLQSMDGNNGPGVIGLAEIENNSVLNDLVHQPEIAKHGYQFICFDGPDPRGINVALLYDPKLFRVLKSEPIYVDLSGVRGKSATRNVLHVSGVLENDSVHLFINHWPSRAGGTDESSTARAIAAKVTKSAIESILKTDPRAKIIIMGDFNDNPTDSSIFETLGAKGDMRALPGNGLYNPWIDIYNKGQGTERFRHTWNLFDQEILSGNFLLNQNHKLQFDRVEIFKPDFIIDHYKSHEGEPHRSFAGTHWINGYSDHFPIILYLRNLHVN